MKYKVYRGRQVVYCANEKQLNKEIEEDFDYFTEYTPKEEYVLKETLKPLDNKQEEC